MPTIKLVASSYSTTGTVTVTDPANMYTDVSSTTYARLTHTSTGTTSYYCYIKGFNFSAVPDNANVSSITIRIRGYETSLSTSTSYAPRLYNNTTSISGTTASANFGTTASTITIPYTGTWATLKGYGADLGIRVTIRRSNRNTQGYLYIYGAEIEVTYTVPVYHTISITGDTTPTGSQTVLEGSGLAIKYVGAKPTVTDNNVDVTSQLVESTTDSPIYVPNNSTTSNFTVSNISNAYTDADSNTSATLEINGGGVTGTCYLDIPVTLPTGTTLQSVSATVALQFSRNGSSSGFTSSVQMYAGNTAKGSATTWVSSATDVSRTEYNLSIGSWTAQELANARLYLTATNNASSTHRFVYIYGVSLTVTYSASGKIYTYTLSNIQTDHVIIFAASATDTIYFKSNGSWVSATKVYKKINGSWVQQTDLTSVFDSNTNYVKGG